MKLSQYAQKAGVTYRTAWLWYKDGKIKGYQMPTGTIVITEDERRARLYGQRRAKRKTEQITRQFEENDNATG